jgi:hypothetical protein
VAFKHQSAVNLSGLNNVSYSTDLRTYIPQHVLCVVNVSAGRPEGAEISECSFGPLLNR